MELNFDTLCLLLFFNGAVFIPTYRHMPKDTFSVYYFLIAISTFIYSGLGMCFQEIGTDYLFSYIVFYTIYLLTMYICRMRYYKKQISLCTNKKQGMNRQNIKTLQIGQYGIFGSGIRNMMTIIFFGTFLVFLVIPENRLYMIFQPPVSTVIGGYSRIVETEQNIILDLALLIRSVCLPFFMLTLKKVSDNGRRVKMSLLIALWIYLQFLSQLYIGRTEFLVFVFFFLLLVSRKDPLASFFISNKMMVLSTSLLIFSVPVLLEYQYLRLGLDLPSLPFVDALTGLVSTELFLPQYYPQLSVIGESISPLSYFLWILLLPVPSIILPFKGSLTIQINRIFSSQILGISYGSYGYSGLVTSIFGESLFLYGDYFFFIHAIVLGILIFTLYRFFINYKELSIMNLYFAVNAVTIARGGSQGFLGMAINSLVFYVIICFIFTPFMKSVKSHNSNFEI